MADDYVVRVRIGAGLDTRSFDATLGDARNRAKRAFADMAKASVVAERQGGRERVQVNKAALQEIAAIEKGVRQEGRAYLRQIGAETRAAAREAAALARVRGTAERKEIAATQAAERAAQRERERFAFRTSHRATRFLFPTPAGAFGYASRVASGLMRGIGVDMSLGSGVGRAVSLEKQAQILANQAFQPGQAGAAGVRVPVNELISEAHKQAGKYGIEGGAETIIGGQTKFNKLTGDLRMARDLTEDMVKLSAATGSNFEETMGAAAVLSRKLGEIPNKQQTIYDLMRGFAWQGKLGAVEIADLANTMPRLLSGVTRFAGNAGDNIAKMGALAQLARGGPAGTAREAATGVARMADLFVTPTRIKAMEKLGLKKSDIFNKQGLVNDPFEIIKKALTVTGGDPLKMKGMFSSIMGSKPVERLSDLYRQGGGKAGGLAAVDKEVRTLMSGSGIGMSKQVVAEMAASQAETTAAKAAKFQEKLDVIAESLTANLLPELEKLAPVVFKVMEAFEGLVTFTAGHLPSAIMLAITAAIARAGIESSFRMGIDRMLGASSPAMSTWQTGFKTFGGGLMTTTQTLGTFAIAIGSTSAALELWDAYLKKKAVGESGSLTELDTAYQTGVNQIAGNKNLTPEQKEAAKADLAKQAMKRLEWIEKEKGAGDWLPDWAQAAEHQKNKGIELEMRKQYARAQVTDASVLAQYGGGQVTNEGIAQALLDALSHTTIKTDAHVTNASELRPTTGPEADPTGRTPRPGQRPP